MGSSSSEKPDSEFLARLRSLAADAETGPLELATPRQVELFLSLPVEQRKRFRPWLGKAVPLWNGDCLCCDGPIVCANDSYGLSTYTRTYWCRACGWRDEQPTDEPTMASLYEEMHRQEVLEKRLAITDQAALEAIPELAIEHVAEVTRAPDDIAARLRFAEWARSQGRVELAEAIRKACAPPPTHWDEPWRQFENSKWYGPPA